MNQPEPMDEYDNIIRSSGQVSEYAQLKGAQYGFQRYLIDHKDDALELQIFFRGLVLDPKTGEYVQDKLHRMMNDQAANLLSRFLLIRFKDIMMGNYDPKEIDLNMLDDAYLWNRHVTVNRVVYDIAENKVDIIVDFIVKMLYAVYKRAQFGAEASRIGGQHVISEERGVYGEGMMRNEVKDKDLVSKYLPF